MTKAQRPKLLVPVDFSPYTQPTLKQAAFFAENTGADLLILYVIENTGIFSSLFSSSQKRETEDKVNEKLNELVEQIPPSPSVKTETVVRFGRIHSTINEIAKEQKVKYIIMGTTGNDDDVTVHQIIGANTSRVIRSAPCPVITINSMTAHDKCTDILVPLDLTTETRQKVPYAYDFAKAFQAKIHIISALWSKNNIDVINRLKLQQIQVKQFFESNNIAAVSEIIESEGGRNAVDKVILQYLKTHNEIDMITIMTQQETDLIQFFVSSSTQEIIRNCQIPVMSIQPKELGFRSIMS